MEFSGDDGSTEPTWCLRDRLRSMDDRLAQLILEADEMGEALLAIHLADAHAVIGDRYAELVGAQSIRHGDG